MGRIDNLKSTLARLTFLVGSFFSILYARTNVSFLAFVSIIAIVAHDTLYAVRYM